MQEDIQPRLESSKKLASLANDALKAFREDNPQAFKELVEVYSGKSADLALFGHGKFHIAVKKGEVEIQPDKIQGSGATGRGATTPETLMAILEGKLTVLEAFHKGDLVARANSAELHRAYDFFARFSDAAMRSKKLQKVLSDFRSTFGQK
ncbi:MAG: hypothetical protein OEV08_00135 [Nitrospira sp.]|nr:hypothetical protein [Nitrospira sp.]